MSKRFCTKTSQNRALALAATPTLVRPLQPHKRDPLPPCVPEQAEQDRQCVFLCFQTTQRPSSPEMEHCPPGCMDEETAPANTQNPPLCEFVGTDIDCCGISRACVQVLLTKQPPIRLWPPICTSQACLRHHVPIPARGHTHTNSRTFTSHSDEHNHHTTWTHIHSRCAARFGRLAHSQGSSASEYRYIPTPHAMCLAQSNTHHMATV